MGLSRAVLKFSQSSGDSDVARVTHSGKPLRPLDLKLKGG